MWTRKRTRIAGRILQDDWIVHRDGLPVGRVRLDYRENPGRNVWLWFKQTVPGTHGEADTLDEALEAVRKAILSG